MRLPTVPRLMSIGIDKPTAKAVRDCLIRTENSAAPAWDELNLLLDGCGKESIPRGNNNKSPAISYINLGDAYTTTLLYVRRRWMVGCWGDIVEKGDYE